MRKIQQEAARKYATTVETLGSSLMETVNNPQLRAQAVKNPAGIAAARSVLETHFTDTNNQAGIDAIAKINPNGTFKP